MKLIGDEEAQGVQTDLLINNTVSLPHRAKSGKKKDPACVLA